MIEGVGEDSGESEGREGQKRLGRLLVVGCGWWYDREIFVALIPRRFSHQRLIAL